MVSNFNETDSGLKPPVPGGNVPPSEAAIQVHSEVAVRFDDADRQLIERQCKTMEALKEKLDEFLQSERAKNDFAA